MGVGENGAAVWTSTDALTWHRVADDPVYANAQIDDVIRGEQGIVAVGTTYDTEVLNQNVIWTAPAP